MENIINFLNSIGILDMIIASIGICIMALMTIYIPGRMLNFIKSYRIKNIIAIIIMSISTYYYLKVFKTDINNIAKFWYLYVQYLSITIVIYTIFGMRLFDRIDTWLDKKGLKNKEKLK